MSNTSEKTIVFICFIIFMHISCPFIFNKYINRHCLELGGIVIENPLAFNGCALPMGKDRI